MKTILHSASVVALAVTAYASTASAQDASAPDELRALVQDVASSSAQLKQVDAEWETLTIRIRRWAAELKKHNDTRCTYAQGHPEQCAHYDREAEELMAQRASLNGEYDDLEKRRQVLRFHVHDGLSRLRVRRFAANLQGLESWVERVRACAALPSEVVAATCLTAEWEAHP